MCVFGYISMYIYFYSKNTFIYIFDISIPFVLLQVDTNGIEISNIYIFDRSAYHVLITYYHTFQERKK